MDDSRTALPSLSPELARAWWYGLINFEQRTPAAADLKRAMEVIDEAGARLFAGEGHHLKEAPRTIGVVGREQHGTDGGLTGQALKCGRIGNEDGVVLVLPGHGQPFWLKGTHNLTGKVRDAYHFPNRIFDTEQLIAHGSPDHANVCGSIYVVLGECDALVNKPSFYVEKFG